MPGTLSAQRAGGDGAHTRYNELRIQNKVIKCFGEGPDETATTRALEKFAVLGLPLRTIQRWKSHYDKFGESPRATEMFLGTRYASTKRRATKLRTGHLRILKAIVEENPAWYLDEISDEFHRRKQDQLSFHYTTLWRALRNRCGYSLRVSTAKAAQRDAVLRAEFRLAGAAFPLPEMFVFIDESSKDRNAARRRRAWAKRGRPCDVTEDFDADCGSHYTLLAAADIDGFVPEMCDLVFRKRNAADKDPTRGTVDTERFLEWVDFFLVPHLGRCDRLEKRSIVVADNAAIHTDPRFIEKVEAAGAQVLFLSPYSPDYNPIEVRRDDDCYSSSSCSCC